MRSRFSHFLNAIHKTRVIAAILILALFFYGENVATANNSSWLFATFATISMVSSIGQVVFQLFNANKIASFFTRSGPQALVSQPLALPQNLTRQKLRRFFFVLAFATALVASAVAYYIVFTPHTNVVTTASNDGPGSLRQIYQGAPAGDTITFASNLQNIPIIVSTNLTLNKNIRLLGIAAAGGNKASVSPGVQGKEDNVITIGNTNGAKIYIPQGSNILFEHLNISSSSVVALSSFIDNQGNLTLSHCVVTGNHSSYNGGGFSNLGGTLTLNDSYVFGNHSDNDGGAIYNWDGLLTLNHTTIQGNIAEHNGGTIYNLRGTVILLNRSSISDNDARNGDGGGIESRNGSLTLTGNSEVVDNIATGDGGGIIVVSGQTQLDATSITRNRAGQRGGGIAVEPDTDNGYAGQVTTLNSKIDANYLGNTTNSTSASNIWGNLIPGTHSALITSKDVGTQANVYHPEQNPQYLGTIDVDQYNQYCRKLNPDRYFGASIGMTAFSIFCIATSGNPDDAIPLTHLATDPFQEICASLYNFAPNAVIERLGSYNDPTSWQCYKNEKLLGHITTDIAAPGVTKLDEYCKSQQYDGAKLFGTTVYDWKCHLTNGGDDGLSMAAACQNEYGTQSIDVLKDYNNPNSWECWGLSK